ncbi:hypothetical protein BGW36DRAFT_462132 [Talaromyces proteolyticus]|uniref:Uncharacterized protein n=1 Tax=Talaromyces proteolyticus TaxID=1131652 RepID=A0AAD4KUC7_9EURO|nr:uncharacterized protein BGW36DRAFT_462132 [Talaromyces proteolyticus]KAH8696224.1 hypothetical protein BGW36DRAFT_462132 [Talaromyces proteolyticus]
MPSNTNDKPDPSLYPVPQLGNFQKFWDELRSISPQDNPKRYQHKEEALKKLYFLRDTSRLSKIGEKLSAMRYSSDGNRVDDYRMIIYVLDMRCSIIYHPFWNLASRQCGKLKSAEFVWETCKDLLGWFYDKYINEKYLGKIFPPQIPPAADQAFKDCLKQFAIPSPEMTWTNVKKYDIQSDFNEWCKFMDLKNGLSKPDLADASPNPLQMTSTTQKSQRVDRSTYRSPNPSTMIATTQKPRRVDRFVCPTPNPSTMTSNTQNSRQVDQPVYQYPQIGDFVKFYDQFKELEDKKHRHLYKEALEEIYLLHTPREDATVRLQAVGEKLKSAQLRNLPVFQPIVDILDMRASIVCHPFWDLEGRPDGLELQPKKVSIRKASKEVLDWFHKNYTKDDPRAIPQDKLKLVQECREKFCVLCTKNTWIDVRKYDVQLSFKAWFEFVSHKQDISMLGGSPNLRD